MPLGIDPTVDYVFKKLFATPENSDLLIHLLNSVLQFSQPIVYVEVLNPFNEKEFEEDKLSILDIKARCGDDRWYNVEIQSKSDWSLRPRLAYYAASLYADQLSEGEDYGTLTPAITICFLKESLFRDSQSPHLRFSLCDPMHRIELTDRLQVHTIELAKYNFEGVTLDSVDALAQWAFFLGHAGELEAESLQRLLPRKEFLKATGVVEMIARTPEERVQYELRRKAEMDRRWSLNIARREGREEGIELGREEGIEAGQKLGLVDNIHLLQELLQVPPTATEELMARELAALKLLSADLKNRLQQPR